MIDLLGLIFRAEGKSFRRRTILIGLVPNRDDSGSTVRIAEWV